MSDKPYWPDDVDLSEPVRKLREAIDQQVIKMSDRPLNERVQDLLEVRDPLMGQRFIDPHSKKLIVEIAALEQERDDLLRMNREILEEGKREVDRLQTVLDAAEWMCPDCSRVVSPEQETCRCGFDRAIVVNKSATDDDVMLDSPNWLSRRLKGNNK